MENKREIKYRIKVVLFLIVIIVTVAYSKNFISKLTRETAKMKIHANTKHQLVDKASEKTKTRHLWDRVTKKPTNNWSKYGDFETEQAFVEQKQEQSLPDTKQDRFGNNGKEDNKNKENKKTTTVKSGVAKAQNKSVIKSQNIVKDHGSTKVSNKTTPRKTLTLGTVRKIVKEILDKMNISNSNSSSGKQFQQTNQLSHSAVGNISKEIMKQNLSAVIAKAVISALSSRGGLTNSRNATLRRQLLKDYMNNTNLKPLKYAPQSGQYMDKYQRLNANNQPMMPVGYPKQIPNNQGYRGKGQMMQYRDNHQESVNSQPGYKGQPKQSYMDQGQDLRYSNQPKQRYVNQVGQYFNQQSKQGYKDNLPRARAGQTLPYKAAKQSRPRETLQSRPRETLQSRPRETLQSRPRETLQSTWDNQRTIYKNNLEPSIARYQQNSFRGYQQQDRLNRDQQDTVRGDQQDKFRVNKQDKLRRDKRDKLRQDQQDKLKEDQQDKVRKEQKDESIDKQQDEVRDQQDKSKDKQDKLKEDKEDKLKEDKTR